MTQFILWSSEAKQRINQAEQTTEFPTGISPVFLPVFSPYHGTDKSSLNERKHSSQHVQWDLSWQIFWQAIPGGTHSPWVVFYGAAQAEKKEKSILMHPFLSPSWSSCTNQKIKKKRNCVSKKHTREKQDKPASLC